MAEAVYILCAVTSLMCAILLLRAYRRDRMRLLLWNGLCFAGLTLNNCLLFLDLSVFPDIDLSLARNVTSLLAMAVLVFGLVWDTK